MLKVKKLMPYLIAMKLILFTRIVKFAVQFAEK